MKRAERWAPIPGFDGYAVSTLGRVRGRGGVLRPSARGRSAGYLGVVLYRDGSRFSRLVHRLVAEAFLPAPGDPEATQVNHIDYDTRNNRIENLEWATRSENERHKRRRER